MTKQVSSKKNLTGAQLAIENAYTHQVYYGTVTADDNKEIKVAIIDQQRPWLPTETYTFTKRSDTWNMSYTHFGA